MMTWRKQTHLSSLCVYAMCIMAADAVSPPRACVFCARTRKESDLRYFAFIFDGLCHIVDYRNGRLILIVPGPNSLLVVVLERERENGVGGIYISSSIRAEQFSISSPWCCYAGCLLDTVARERGGPAIALHTSDDVSLSGFADAESCWLVSTSTVPRPWPFAIQYI